MLSYCLKCQNKMESENWRIGKTNNRIIMLLSKCAAWYNKKSKFLKEQEASEVLTSLGINRSLS